MIPLLVVCSLITCFTLQDAPPVADLATCKAELARDLKQLPERLLAVIGYDWKPTKVYAACVPADYRPDTFPPKPKA